MFNVKIFFRILNLFETDIGVIILNIFTTHCLGCFLLCLYRTNTNVMLIQLLHNIIII